MCVPAIPAAYIISLLLTILLLPLCMLHLSAQSASVIVGAQRTELYLPMLQGRRTALVAHHASTAQGRHLLQILLDSGIQVVRIFAPEHGWQGSIGAGDHVPNAATSDGIPIISLYGKDKKPAAKHLADVDILLFDMQDVGLRCYTYLSTMFYVMEAAAQHGIPVIVLDRPNPNGHYVDGPVLEDEYRSFVGVCPVAYVHGMTLGELALMINGQGWLRDSLRCQLKVIPCLNYTHSTPYVLPHAPSPSLQSMKAVYLYPWLCFFEGTIMSVGRGTDAAFEVLGHPRWSMYVFTFTPHRNAANRQPPYMDIPCHGVDFSVFSDDYIYGMRSLNIDYLVDAYEYFGDGFFNSMFDYLAGTAALRTSIEAGMSADSIRQTWQAPLTAFKQLRRQYLLYDE